MEFDSQQFAQDILTVESLWRVIKSEMIDQMARLAYVMSIPQTQCLGSGNSIKQVHVNGDQQTSPFHWLWEISKWVFI